MSHAFFLSKQGLCHPHTPFPGPFGRDWRRTSPRAQEVQGLRVSDSLQADSVAAHPLQIPRHGPFPTRSRSPTTFSARDGTRSTRSSGPARWRSSARPRRPAASAGRCSRTSSSTRSAARSTRSTPSATACSASRPTARSPTCRRPVDLAVDRDARRHVSRDRRPVRRPGGAGGGDHLGRLPRDRGRRRRARAAPVSREPAGRHAHRRAELPGRHEPGQRPQRDLRRRHGPARAASPS